jgi:hypothetical protein
MAAEHARGSLKSGANHLADIDRLAIERNRTRRQACHIEKVCDKAGEALRLILDRTRKLVASRSVIKLIVLAQRRHSTRDRGEGRLEVVGQ